jgi:hypothetical protein
MMNKNAFCISGMRGIRRFASWILVLSAALLTLSNTQLRGQSGISLAFNSNGLSSLQYNGVQFLSYGNVILNEVAFQNPDGSISYGSTTSSVVVDSIGYTQTRTFAWGSILTAYSLSGNRLNLTITVTNQSSSPIQTIWINPLALQFPAAIEEYDGNTPLVNSTRGSPAVQSMTYGTGVMALADDDVALPLMLGFPWALDKPANTTFPLDINTGTISMYPNSYPNIQRPIAAGASDQYHISLRFGPPGSTDITLAGDVYQAFGQAFPQQLNWPDRRPIGQLILATSGTNWATNPRGWLLDPTINVTTPAGVASLKTRILAWAQGAVAVLQGMNAQGMITWDIEGEQFPQATSYVCDPRQFAEAAPEMAGIADEYFQIFQNAGLRVGVCIRPQNFVLAPDLSSAQQEVVTDPAQVTQLLIDKATYARNRWGATLFYIDSNVNSDTDPNPIDPSIIQSLQQAFPDSLFVPEHSITQYYAYSAPVKQLNQGYTSTPADARFIYPAGFTVLYTPNGPVQADFSTLVTSVQQGDTLMFRGWFDDEPDNQTVTSIYQAAGTFVQPIVSPQSVTLLPGQTQQFTSTVAGTSNQQVTWSTTPPVGSISPSGLYTAPATILGNQPVTVVATSMANPAKSGTASVVVTAPQPARIVASAGTPQSAVIGMAFSAALQASVQDANGNPMGGIAVSFTAPGAGPSGSFNGSATAISVTNASGVATAPTFTANNQVGSYQVTASLAGSSMSAGFSLNNLASSSAGGSLPGGGSLQGSSTSSSAAANLTTEGTLDWVHWGIDGLDRKAGVTAQLSNYSIVGFGPATSYGNDLRSLSWSDGSPTSSSLVNTTGLFISGVGQGFSFSAPADGTARTLTVHVGGWFSSGTLTAHLTDGSAPDFTNVTSMAFGQFDQNYTLTYQSASTATLIVTWSMAAGTGNVTLNGAALSGSGGSLSGSGASLPGNTVGTASSVTATAGTPQSTIVSMPFGTALQVGVTSGGSPVSGALVQLTAPASGPSATFGGSPTANVFTDANGVATSPTLIANGQAGAYVVIAEVSGAAASASFSLTNMPAGGTGVLQGAVTTLPAAVNLTAEGTSDWVHWGYAINRKANVVQQLSTYSVVGSSLAIEYRNDPRVTSWSDGNPTASSVNNYNGVYVPNVGQGFSLTAPADTSLRNLTVHVGGWNSGGTLTAQLSDGSAAVFTDMTPVAAGQYDRNYTLTYQAASAGQTITLSWIMSSGTGNVTLSSATLH